MSRLVLTVFKRDCSTPYCDPYYNNPQKLEHPDLHTPTGILKGIPALIILKPCSNFLEFTVRTGTSTGLGIWGLGFGI